MVDFLNKSKPSDLYPLILLAEGYKISGSYNALVLDRNRILKSTAGVGQNEWATSSLNQMS
jgi:hypothetical protein